MKSTLYFDYAAATPMDPAVMAAMTPYFSKQFYNPSATYLAAQGVKKDIQAARGRIANWLGARPSEIIFTAGGTEANNLAIHGVLRQYPGAKVVTSAIEHESVLQPAAQYAHQEAPVAPDGLIDLKELSALIDDQTVLVSIMYANNEVGSIQPLRHISQLVQSVRRDRQKRGVELPLYLHTDACQAAAYLDLHTARLGVDLLTLNAGKIYGPKQCGALFVSSHVRLQPNIVGGGQERNLRSGTENVAGVIGFAAALDLVQERRHDEGARLLQLQKLFIGELQKAVPNAAVNGTLKNRLPNNVHITLPGTDNERLLMELDEAGILCAAGSACSASNEESSHVLRAMGLSDAEARASLRFTMGRHTDEAAIRHVIAALAKVTLLRMYNLGIIVIMSEFQGFIDQHAQGVPEGISSETAVIAAVRPRQLNRALQPYLARPEYKGIADAYETAINMDVDPEVAGLDKLLAAAIPDQPIFPDERKFAQDIVDARKRLARPVRWTLVGFGVLWGFAAGIHGSHQSAVERELAQLSSDTQVTAHAHEEHVAGAVELAYDGLGAVMCGAAFYGIGYGYRNRVAWRVARWQVRKAYRREVR